MARGRKHKMEFSREQLQTMYDVVCLELQRTKMEFQEELEAENFAKMSVSAPYLIRVAALAQLLKEKIG